MNNNQTTGCTCGIITYRCTRDLPFLVLIFNLCLIVRYAYNTHKHIIQHNFHLYIMDSHEVMCITGTKKIHYQFVTDTAHIIWDFHRSSLVNTATDSHILVHVYVFHPHMSTSLYTKWVLNIVTTSPTGLMAVKITLYLTSNCFVGLYKRQHIVKLPLWLKLWSELIIFCTINWFTVQSYFVNIKRGSLYFRKKKNNSFTKLSL